MAHVIGITGLAGAGKDTCALAMQSAFAQLGARAVLEGYADPIRKIAYVAGLNPYDRKTKEVKHTLSPDVFYDRLQHGIELVLGGRISVIAQGRLYSYTVDACAQFIDNSVPSCPAMHISSRDLMQVLGTEGGQRIRRTFWVDLASIRWDRMPGYVLVSDFRFMHEVPPLDRIIVVDRKGIKRVNGHVSEDLAERLTKERPHYLDAKLVHRLENNRTQEKFEARCARYAKFVHSMGYPG